MNSWEEDLQALAFPKAEREAGRMRSVPQEAGVGNFKLTTNKVAFQNQHVFWGKFVRTD